MYGDHDWLDVAVRLSSTGSQGLRYDATCGRTGTQKTNKFSTYRHRTPARFTASISSDSDRLRQLKRKLWFRAFPLLHGVVLWMFNTVGEPPPDVNARVLVSGVVTQPNLDPWASC